MASINPPVCDFGWQAPDFNLPDFNPIFGNASFVSRDFAMGKNGLLVMFICNHCPYVKAIMPRLIADVAELKMLGVNTVAIMSNDPTDYTEDSVENMQIIARKMNFGFPYLLDASQQTSKNYGAVCTPDFFGFNKKFELQYRGRFDESRKETAPKITRDLFNAMKLVAESDQGPKEQVASIGCSIKWSEV